MRPPWDLLLLLVSALLGALLGCMAEQQVLVKRVQEGGTVVLNCTEASDVNHWFWLPDFQECAEGKPASEQFDGRIEMTSNPNCELVLSNLTARDAGKLIVPESMHRNVELVITPALGYERRPRGHANVQHQHSGHPQSCYCTGLHIEASPHGPFVASTSVNLTCRLPRHASSAPPVRWTFFTLGKGADEQHGEVVTASMEGLWTCTVGDRDTHFCLSKSRKKVLLSPYATQYDCKPQTMLPEKAMAVPNHVLDRYQGRVNVCIVRQSENLSHRIASTLSSCSFCCFCRSDISSSSDVWF
ncbi:uncharacterized protein LOC144723495 isoform X2 [Lampetra planeri]